VRDGAGTRKQLTSSTIRMPFAAAFVKHVCRSRPSKGRSTGNVRRTIRRRCACARPTVPIQAQPEPGSEQRDDSPLQTLSPTYCALRQYYQRGDEHSDGKSNRQCDHVQSDQNANELRQGSIVASAARNADHSITCRRHLLACINPMLKRSCQRYMANRNEYASQAALRGTSNAIGGFEPWLETPGRDSQGGQRRELEMCAPAN